MNKNKELSAFTLVELAIVLVIIGLIVGGILVGSSLIRAAELRTVISEFNQYKAAIYTFREKYKAIPGDMVNATQFWGRADTGGFSGQCAAPTTNTGTSPQTCNGNGDKRVPSSTGNEMWRFWQHLSNAGLISGQYTGITGSSGSWHGVIGENCPASRLSDAGWSLDDVTVNNTNNWYIPTLADENTLVIGGSTASSQPSAPRFSPQEAYDVDTKMDDGMPGKGKVWVTHWSVCTDATANTEHMTARYKLEETAKLCAITFPYVF